MDLDRFARGLTRFGRFYNRYSCVGFSKIPKQGPALLVFYHGFVPTRFFLLCNESVLENWPSPCGFDGPFGHAHPSCSKISFLAVGAIEGTRDNAAAKSLKQAGSSASPQEGSKRPSPVKSSITNLCGESALGLQNSPLKTGC
jgi:hypothetical protein